jgi:MFS family permease
MLLGATSGVGIAALMLAAAGAGAMLSDVAGRTLLQRVVPDEVLTRVFGVLEGLYMAGLAVGSVGAAVLVDTVGARAALLLVGAIPPAAALLSNHGLAVADRRAAVPAAEVEAIRAIPMFAPLPERVVERLARNLIPIEAAAGKAVLRQGEAGDRFYIVRSGDLDVVVDGHPAGALGAGAAFGEIALLRDVPRTASVVARTAVALSALEREVFLEAVTGHPVATLAAEDTVHRHLPGGDAPDG